MTPSTQRTRQLFAVAAAVLFLTYMFLVVWISWVCDDARITLRTVLNFVSGHGLVFNPGERVQGFTHPLWLFVLVAVQFVLPDLFAAILYTSLGLSAAAFLLLLTRIGRARSWTLVAAWSLVSSKAFVDFSTSGLENPLSHALLAVFVLVALAPEKPDDARLAASVGVSSLLTLTRPDLVLLVLPSLIGLARQHTDRPKDAARAVATGLIPLAAWVAFSLFYYGIPIPNTALAKLATGIPLEKSVIQGVRYFFESATHDPVTLTVIGVAVVSGAVVHRSAEDTPLALALVLYLAYLLSIGGDFMSGRLLTPPLFVAACILARIPDPRPRVVLPIFLLLGYLGVFARPNLLGSLDHSYADYPGEYGLSGAVDHGIVDERSYFMKETGYLVNRASPLTRADWMRRHAEHDPAAAFSMSVTCGYAGRTAIDGGPDHFVLDTCGLTDPLLSRLPADPYSRIGHFQRTIPDGYEDAIREDRNLVHDPDLRAYYEVIRLVTRGPLWSPARWKAIVELNLGHHDHLVAGRVYVDPSGASPP